jgi:hypothetical protein
VTAPPSSQREIVINDMRELVFPLFSVPSEGDTIRSKQRIFLGTGFFVSKRGDAITASHILPPPASLQAGHRVIAVVHRNGVQHICWVTRVASLGTFDVALFHVDIAPTTYWRINDAEVLPGTDVQIVGIPSHEVHQEGKECES